MSRKNKIARATRPGYQYDSAGNLIAAPPTGTAYTFDAENHLISTGGQSYLYDGDGKRVEKASGSPLTANKLYWYGTDRNPVIETNAAGNEIDRYFYFAGKLVVREEANDAVNHYASDALGNVRYVYGTAGAPDRSDYYPFGGERVYQSQANNHYKFTAKERDSESGLDNFGARYNSSSMGRFMSPDPSNIGVDRRYPQSWNAYSYSVNNPLNLTDPTGLYVCEDSTKCDSENDKKFAKSLSDARAAADSLDHSSQDYKDAIKSIDAYGNQGEDNGVNVRFDANVTGAVTEVSGVANGNKSADLNPNGQNINVTFNPNAVGGDYSGGLVAHEGSHVADGSAWVASGFSAKLNPTNLTTELNAYHVQFNLINALGVLLQPPGYTYTGGQLDFKNGPLSWKAGDTFKQVTPDLQQKIKENYKNLDSPAFRKGGVLEP
jgi:RHS repeat-associated protein